MQQNLISPLSPSAVRACQNLRPADGSSRLYPVGKPVEFNTPQGWKLLVDEVDRDLVLVYRGNQIGFAHRDFVPHPFTLKAEPWYHNIDIIKDRLYIGDIAGNDYELHIDLDTLAITEVPRIEPDAPVLRAVDAGNIRTTLNRCRLAGSYPADSTLAPSDIRVMQQAAADTYRRFDRLARASALCWQPVVAALRVLDRQGAEIYRSEPALYTRPDGRQFDGRFVFARTADPATAATEVTAPAFRLEVVTPALPADVRARMGSVEVLATPVLYRHRLDADPAVASVRTTDPATLAHAILVPSAAGEGVSPGEGRPRHILDILARFDSLARVVWSAAAASLSETFAAVVAMNPAGTVDDDADTLARALAHNVDKAPYTEVMLSAPHTFAASLSARGAASVLYAGLSVGRAAPPSPRSLAAATGTGAWHGAVKVDFADGSSQVAVAEGLDAPPVSMLPVLSYPAPDAVALTVIVSAAGTVRQGRFPLVPDPSGRRAVYVSPALVPFALPDTVPAFAVPPEQPARIDMPDVLAAADSSSPRSIRAHTRLASGTVSALAAARFGQSSWDFGRSRFYVFASSGIHLLNADTARRSLSLSLLDSRAIAGPEAVVPTDTAVAAVAAGDVLSLSGSKISRIARIPQARGLAWSADDRELWCLTPTSAEILCADHGYGRYTLPAAYERAGHNMLRDPAAGTLHRPGHNPFSLGIDVLWQADIDLPATLRGPVPISIDAHGRYSGLAIDIRRRYGPDAASAPDVRLTLNGTFSSPLRRRPLMLPLRQARITISGPLAPSTPLPVIKVNGEWCKVKSEK